MKMAVRPQPKIRTKKSPAPAVVIGLFVVLVAFIGWMAKSNFHPGPTVAPITQQARSNNDRMHQLAVQSGGDISKLTEEDRNWVNTVSGGHGTDVMRGLATHSMQ